MSTVTPTARPYSAAPPPPRAFWTVKEFGEITGTCKAHVFNMIRRGELRAVKLGSATRIPASEVDRLTNGGAS